MQKAENKKKFEILEATMNLTVQEIANTKVCFRDYKKN